MRTSEFTFTHTFVWVCAFVHVCGCVHSCMCAQYRIWSCHIVITSANTGLERVDWSHPVGQPWEKMRSDRPHNTAWDINNSPPPPSPAPSPYLCHSFFLSLCLCRENVDNASRISKERGATMSRNERISPLSSVEKNLWHRLSLALMKVFSFLFCALSSYMWCMYYIL